MPNVVTVKITGLAELEQKLEQAPLKISRRILREALKPAADVWADDMRSRVLQGPHHEKGQGTLFGLIARSIRTRISVKSDLEAKADVGPGRNEYWARFVELGTRLRRRGGAKGYSLVKGRRLKNRGGASSGVMPATPFIRPSFESRKKEVLATFINNVRDKLRAEGFPV